MPLLYKVLCIRARRWAGLEPSTLVGHRSRQVFCAAPLSFVECFHAFY